MSQVEGIEAVEQVDIGVIFGADAFYRKVVDKTAQLIAELRYKGTSLVFKYNVVDDIGVAGVVHDAPARSADNDIAFQHHRVAHIIIATGTVQMQRVPAAGVGATTYKHTIHYHRIVDQYAFITSAQPDEGSVAHLLDRAVHEHHMPSLLVGQCRIVFGFKYYVAGHVPCRGPQVVTSRRLVVVEQGIAAVCLVGEGNGLAYDGTDFQQLILVFGIVGIGAGKFGFHARYEDDVTRLPSSRQHICFYIGGTCNAVAPQVQDGRFRCSMHFQMPVADHPLAEQERIPGGIDGSLVGETYGGGICCPHRISCGADSEVSVRSYHQGVHHQQGMHVGAKLQVTVHTQGEQCHLTALIIRHGMGTVYQHPVAGTRHRSGTPDGRIIPVARSYSLHGDVLISYKGEDSAVFGMHGHVIHMHTAIVHGHLSRYQGGTCKEKNGV